MWSDLLNDPLDFFTKKRYVFNANVARFITVNPGYNARLDLVALDTLSLKSNWYILAELNNIINPFDEIKNGLQLNIIANSDINEFLRTINEVYVEEVVTLNDSE